MPVLSLAGCYVQEIKPSRYAKLIRLCIPYNQVASLDVDPDCMPRPPANFRSFTSFQMVLVHVHVHAHAPAPALSRARAHAHTRTHTYTLDSLDKTGIVMAIRWELNP